MKPKALYHASPNRNLKIIEPRAESVRDEKEGAVVFATPDKAESSKFLVPSDDSWTRKMRFGDIHIHIISDRERYIEADKGGTIYKLSPETFEHDKTRGTNTEWTSKVAVKPIGREDYESGLQAQLDNGVQVYFVDKATFEKIINSQNHGNTIIRSLNSENVTRGIKPKQVPDINKKSNKTIF